MNTKHDDWVSVQCSTTGLNFHVYWTKMFDNVIHKPALRKCISANHSQLNLTQTGVKYLLLIYPNAIKTSSFFSTIWFYIHTSKKSNQYKQVIWVHCLSVFCFTFIAFCFTVFWNFILKNIAYICLKVKMYFEAPQLVCE